MKFKNYEKDTLNTYMAGIDKFLAIAVVKDNRGESSLDAIMAAKELVLEMKDYMTKNEEFDSKTETRTETFAEHCLRENAAEQKLKGGDKT